MAKTKTKSKARKTLPKRIAGVKVPKAVRKSRFGELLASRAGQALIAEALLAAGAVAAGKKASRNPRVRDAAHEAKEMAVHAGHDVRHDMADAGATLAYALGEAARAFAEALRRDDGVAAEPRSFAPDDGGEDVAWTPDYGAPEAATEPARSSSPGKGARKKQPTANDAGPP